MQLNFLRRDAEGGNGSKESQEFFYRQHNPVWIVAQFLLLFGVPRQPGYDVAQHCRDSIKTPKEEIEAVSQYFLIIPFAAFFGLKLHDLGHIVITRRFAAFGNLCLEVGYGVAHAAAAHFPIIGMQHRLFP